MKTIIFLSLFMCLTDLSVNAEVIFLNLDDYDLITYRTFKEELDENDEINVVLLETSKDNNKYYHYYLANPLIEFLNTTKSYIDPLNKLRIKNVYYLIIKNENGLAKMKLEKISNPPPDLSGDESKIRYFTSSSNLYLSELNLYQA